MVKNFVTEFAARAIVDPLDVVAVPLVVVIDDAEGIRLWVGSMATTTSDPGMLMILLMCQTEAKPR